MPEERFIQGLGGAPLRAVVTGTSRGIGRAIALAVAACGGHVAGTFEGGDAEQAALHEEIAELGGTGLLRDVDVSDRAAVLDFAAEVVASFGGIDLWVNNAARLLVRPFTETSPREWLDLFSVNVFGYVWGCEAAVTAMRAAGSGCIVNIGSVVLDQPPTHFTAYTSAKGAITGLTRALAVEVAQDGIRVNAIAPGAIDTPLNAAAWTEEVRARYEARIPMRRLGEASDVADAVLLLASPGARYVTGQVLRVDGGLILDGSVGHGSS